MEILPYEDGGSNAGGILLRMCGDFMVCHKWECGCSRTPFSSTVAIHIELLSGRRLGPQRTLQSNIGCSTGIEFTEEKQLEFAEKQFSLSLSLVWDHQPLWDQPCASFCPISIYILWRVVIIFSEHLCFEDALFYLDMTGIHGEKRVLNDDFCISKITL